MNDGTEKWKISERLRKAFLHCIELAREFSVLTCSNDIRSRSNLNMVQMKILSVHDTDEDSNTCFRLIMRRWTWYDFLFSLKWSKDSFFSLHCIHEKLFVYFVLEFSDLRKCPWMHENCMRELNDFYIFSEVIYSCRLKWSREHSGNQKFVWSVDLKSSYFTIGINKFWLFL